ncbi:MAG: phosphodiester glycosidase family protein [Bacilli bacterium]|nr:phosphodiester glycosidase family protein [Bacilli bacterium]
MRKKKTKEEVTEPVIVGNPDKEPEKKKKTRKKIKIKVKVEKDPVTGEVVKKRRGRKKKVEEKQLRDDIVVVEDNRKLKKFHIHSFTIGVTLMNIIVIAGLVMINLESFRTFWVTSAMTTMTHKFWAYTLYSEKTITKIMSENYIEINTDGVNLDDIVIGDTSAKTHYASKYEKELYTRDEGNEVYKIIRLDEGKYKGYLTVVYDPSDVELAVSSKLGRMGENVATLCKNNGGLVGINAGGFEDLDGWGNGSVPLGAIIKNGELVWNHPGGSGTLIGFTKEHKLVMTPETPEEAIAHGMKDAIEFGPNLIVNGKVSKIHGDGGWGTAPRSVIAQRRDGIVLLLLIEGRIPGYALGATMNDVIEVLLRYGAYNAANLDGGASTTMAVNGKLYNRPSAGGEYGGRTVSNAWIVTNHNGKTCVGCPY